MSTNYFNITDKKTWQNSLGLLPTNFLFDSLNQFVMQNGNVNNFCIDFINQYDIQQYQHYSWASDTNCFLSISNNKLSIYRWDKKDVIEKINLSYFSATLLAKLYKYIGSFTQPKEKSIVPIIMDVFGKLRNSSGSSNGLSALKSLLFLLAKTNDENPNLENWGLDDNAGKDLPILFDKVYEDFQSKINNEINTTNILLRHASGRLFQEAHYQAILNPQLDIFEQPAPISKVIKNKELEGVHFTPSFITRSIVEESLRKFDFTDLKEIKILDPACGSGEFLKEALRQIIEIKTEFKGGIKLYGWDKSVTAIQVAKFSLYFEKNQYSSRAIEIEVIEKDSLEDDWGIFDIILMNPPFVSWELLSTATQDKVQAALENYSVNRPNLASPFFYKAIKSLKLEGVLGCVLPYSIFNADSYKSLREFSLQNLSIDLIGKLGNLNLFYNAVVDAGVFITQKKDKNINNSSVILWADNSLNSTTDALRNLRIFQQSPLIPKSEKNFSIYTSTYNTVDYPKVVSYFSNQLEAKLITLLQKGNFIYVEDIFMVKLGARTGANDTFLISANFYEHTLNNKEKKYFKPVITNKAIKNGVVYTTEYLWYPYVKNRIKSEAELQTNVPNYYEYFLKNNEPKLKKRPEVVKGKYHWWELNREGTWQNQEPKLVSTEFGRAGYFAFDIKGEYVVERGNAWIIKQEKIKDVDIIEEDLNFAYLALFCSSFFNDLLAIYSKQIAGGQYYLGGKFVNSIPIPDFTETDMNPYFIPLIELGKKISDKSFNNTDEEILSTIVKSVYKF